MSSTGLKVNEKADSYIVNGIVENVVLLGTPIGCNLERWRCARSVVSGRFVNGYYPNDWVLSLLYRTKSWDLQIAGVHPVHLPPINKTLQNVDTKREKRKTKEHNKSKSRPSVEEQQEGESERENNEKVNEFSDNTAKQKEIQRQQISDLLDNDHYSSSPKHFSPQKIHSDSPGKNHPKASDSTITSDSTSDNQEAHFRFSNGGIENIDLTGIVKGHLHYPDVLYQIMKFIGLED